MAAALNAPPGTPEIRVAIVEDHPVVREGTAAILSNQPGISVEGTAGSLAEARELLARIDVDVVLLDIRLGTESGLGLLARNVIGSHSSTSSDEPAVVVLTAYDYPQYADAARRLGAAGFVLKTAPLAEIVEAIRAAATSGHASGTSTPWLDAARPTARELDVVRLVIDGRSNDEIGVTLGIGSRTVETHLRRLFERFGVASRTELSTRALREGWLEVPPA